MNQAPKKHAHLLRTVTGECASTTAAAALSMQLGSAAPALGASA